MARLDSETLGQVSRVLCVVKKLDCKQLAWAPKKDSGPLPVVEEALGKAPEGSARAGQVKA